MAGALADHDGFVGELECAGYVAGLLREVRPNECQISVGIGFGPAVERDITRVASRRSTTEGFPRSTNAAAIFERNKRRTNHVTGALVGHERSLGDRHTKVGVPGEECRDRERFEVWPLKRRCRVGLRKLLERLAPCMPCERRAADAQGLRNLALGGRRQLAHWRRSYSRSGRHRPAVRCQAEARFTASQRVNRWVSQRPSPVL